MDVEIIGTRPNSGFRVREDYFFNKRRFSAGIDPTTGGPCAVVYAGTDDRVPGAYIDRDPESRDYGRVVIPQGRTLPAAPPAGGAPVAEETIAAATAVLGYDLLQSNINNQATYPRMLIRAGLAGSAAALDAAIDLYVGRNVVATLYNVATGAVLSDAHFRDVHAMVPTGEQVRAIVTDAPGTNPLNIVVEFDS